MTDANLKVAQAKTQLMLRHPFFGSCAAGLNFVETDKVPTMATDGRSILWNRAFVDSLDKDHVMGVIAHEVLHVVFKHMLRMGKRNPQKVEHLHRYRHQRYPDRQRLLYPQGRPVQHQQA